MPVPAGSDDWLTAVDPATLQTVYIVGNPITTRLRLTVAPDDTTAVTLKVLRPDGTQIAAPDLSDFEGAGADEISARFYATDDGAAGSAVDNSAGDWVAVWTVAGRGAVVTAKVYNVIPLPGTDTRVSWSPFLSEVADHIPFLTEDSVTPGQVWLGTFTGVTMPTDAIAQRHVDAALAMVSARVGTIPASLYPLAGAVVALRAAASILRAFARNRDDRDAADSMDRRADAAYKELVEQAEEEDTATVGVGRPVGFFPQPVVWGDWDL